VAVKTSTLPRTEVQQVLNLLRQARNLDFSGYKRSTLHRRIEHRMRERRCVKVEDYCEILQREPAEADALVSALLIKVTEFFRDPPLWEKLRKHVLPELLARAAANGEMRVWSAGCATGEEAYSIAMVLAELTAANSASVPFRIFGTDRDAGAIATARRGVYTQQQIRTLPARLLERWFERVPEGYLVRKDLRRYLVFGVHDVVNDAPISRLDLILCRNLFIYLDAAAQRRALLHFHHGLKHDGVLVLGKSELIPFAEKLFAPADLPSRIYRKLAYQARQAEYPFTLPAAPREPAAKEKLPILPPAITPFYRDALMALDVAVVVLNRDGVVTVWNEAAARLWGRRESDVIGRPLSEVKWEDNSAGQRLLERAATMRAVRGHVAQETFTLDGERPRTIRLEISPLRSGEHQEPNGFVFMARDITDLQDALSGLRQAEERQREATSKYQAAIDELQSTNEELETTNEELQSANEELQTTNEELQSTNEELETINEELQSTNASLDAVNTELAARTEELNRVNLAQRAMIRALSAAIVGVDSQGQITIWNPAAERMLNRSEEQLRNHNLQRLSLAPLPRAVAARIKRALLRKAALNIEGFDCRLNGRNVKLRCSLIPLSNQEAHYGAMLILEPARNQLAAESAQRRKRV